MDRFDGSDGDISCLLNTVNDSPVLSSLRRAKPKSDFIPIENQRVEFKHSVVQSRIEIIMPDCEIDGTPEEAETVAFALEISDSKPEGVKISKKS